MNRQPLQLPTWLLLDAAGRIVRIYREARMPRSSRGTPAPSRSLRTRGSRERCRSRARFYSALPQRNYLPYGRELLDQGLEPAAIAAFELAARASPGASTLYRLGTLLAKAGETARARERLREGAGAPAGPRRSQQRSRGAARAVGRCRRRDRAVPCRARFDARLSGRAQQPGLRPAC